MSSSTLRVTESNPGAVARLRKRLEGRGLVVNVGFPKADRYAKSGTSVAMVAKVQEEGSAKLGIPARPFVRPAIEKGKPDFSRLNRANLMRIAHAQMTYETALGQLGALAQAKIQNEIRNGSFVPLKAATIRRKGSSRPLIDTGQMVQSVAWVIAKGDQNA